MPRPRSPNRDKAKELWIESGRTRKLKDIAEELGISEEQVRKWKNQDKWDKVTLPKTKSNVINHKSKKEKAIADEVKQVIENHELTDKQRLFCLYYVRCFNATKAYQKAYECSYETAMANGSDLLRNTKIKSEILLLKQNRLNRDFISEEDIFQKYMDIAFADITDYISFGRETVPAMGAFGPVQVKNEETGKKETMMREVNTAKLRESGTVDGSLISEVKQGKDGVSIKLLDKMKALQWLSDHMDMATEEQKARIDVLRAKSQTGDNEKVADDGFIEALKVTAAEDWADEED